MIRSTKSSAIGSLHSAYTAMSTCHLGLKASRQLVLLGNARSNSGLSAFHPFTALRLRSCSSRLTLCRKTSLTPVTSNTLVCLATDGDKEITPTKMSLQDAYALLGLDSRASFEDVVGAKNRLRQASEGDKEKVLQIDSAYDILFSHTLNKRISGELEVSTSVKYADVPATRKKSSAPARVVEVPASRQSQLPVAIAPPQQSAAVTQAAVFGALAFWAIVQALVEPPRLAAGDVAGLQFAVAAAYGFYTFYKTKQLPIGKAAGLTVGSLIVGGLIGGLVQNWLRVDIVPIGSFASPGVLVTDFSIIGIWLGCTFLV